MSGEVGIHKVPIEHNSQEKTLLPELSMDTLLKAHEDTSQFLIENFGLPTHHFNPDQVIIRKFNRHERKIAGLYLSNEKIVVLNEEYNSPHDQYYIYVHELIHKHSFRKTSKFKFGSRENFGLQYLHNGRVVNILNEMVTDFTAYEIVQKSDFYNPGYNPQRIFNLDIDLGYIKSVEILERMASAITKHWLENTSSIPNFSHKNLFFSNEIDKRILVIRYFQEKMFLDGETDEVKQVIDEALGNNFIDLLSQFYNYKKIKVNKKILSQIERILSLEV